MATFPNIRSHYANDANEAAARAANEAATAGRSARAVENRLDRLTLICRAMWELMREKGVASEDELRTKMAIIDASDGVADGKQTERIIKCVKCTRTLPSRGTKCLYCGAEHVPGSIFETI